MIGVLTYNIPHRKTYDTLCLLKAKGYKDVVVFAKPFHYEKKFQPLINHRPASCNDLTPKELCDNFDYQYSEDSIESVLPANSIVLICGAGLIPQDVVEKYRIINSHPGYVPIMRGLDALKWAIYDGQPIGVTTHQLGEYVDAGLIIEKRLVPLYFNDTFHAVAQRQYEMEIVMLVEAIVKIDQAVEFADPQDYPVRKRMPHTIETRVISRFNEMINKLPIE